MTTRSRGGDGHGCVLADGRVTEQGSHAELMAADGGYAELYRLQDQAYR